MVKRSRITVWQRGIPASRREGQKLLELASRLARPAQALYR